MKQSLVRARLYVAAFGAVVALVAVTPGVAFASAAPRITLQPLSATATAGQKVSFKATASGTPVPTVQWQFSTDHGTTWTNTSGGTTRTYTFVTASSENGWQFRAVFTNSVGSATTSAAVLTVQFAPTLTLQPLSQAVNSGQTVSFTALASGQPAPTVQWQYRVNPTSTWANLSGATSTTYSAQVTAFENGWQLQAVFTNTLGAAPSNPATLTINAPPAITQQPSNQVVASGSTATFTAAASGNPAPTVQWQYRVNTSSSWANLSNATSPTYSAVVTTFENGWQVRAVFTNVAGTATTDAANLTVNTAPFITTQPSNVTTASGATATFTAAASGAPAPTVQWQSSSDGGKTWANISGATSTTYSVTVTTGQNGAEFRAVFTNTYGATPTHGAILTVNNSPILTLQPVSTGVGAGDTVTFSSTASGNPTPSVQWQDSVDGASWSNVSGATSTSYSAAVTTVENGWQFRAVFTNTLGTATSKAATLHVYVMNNYTGANINGPVQIVTGPDGALWFVNNGNNSIGRITIAGAVTNFTGTTIAAPTGIAAGPDGALWFTNKSNNSIGRITTAGAVTNYTGTGISAPFGIVAGPDGAMWFANNGNDSIGRITTAGAVTNYTGTGISGPTVLTAGPDSALWFTNQNNNSIGSITTSGSVTDFTGTGISGPSAIVSGPDGALWFCNNKNNSIGRITTTGVVSNYTGSGIDFPATIAAGSDGALWFTNYFGNTIGRITTAGTVISVSDPQISGPTGIATGPDNALWFTNLNNGTIGRLAPS